jgi:uncharacterized protein YggU (UPF0235/DUF167 family)
MDHRRYVVVTVANGTRPGASRVSVKLTPKGGRNAIEGWRLDARGEHVLKARVAAAPENGKANDALIALIANALDIGTSKVRIVSGVSSRTKTIEIEAEKTLIATRLGQAGRHG